MLYQSSSARRDAVLPAYEAMIVAATLGVWLVGFVDVFGQCNRRSNTRPQ